jgi:hypothetical protein
VIARLGTYYSQNTENIDVALDVDDQFDPETFQNELKLPRPILRVFIKNTGRKFLSLRNIESKLEGLVANQG